MNHFIIEQYFLAVFLISHHICLQYEDKGKIMF